MAENQRSSDKKRKSNFTEDEINVLVVNIKKHYKILYGQNSKRYDNRSLRYRAWMDIVKKVNEVSCEKRTLEEIKNKWKKCQHKERVIGWEDLAPKKKLTMKAKHKTKTKHIKATRTVNSYDPDFKRAVILYAEQKGTREAKKVYGVSESNIRRWRTLKNDIYDQLEKKKSSHLLQKRSSGRNSVRKSYALEATEELHTASDPVGDPLDSNEHDNSNSIDSMPLQQRLSHSPDASSSSQPVLQSQPLSPTKLKVTRQSVKSTVVAPQPSPEPPEPEPVKEADQEVCLRWNSHHSNMQEAFPSLLMKEQYVDVTLVAEGQTLKCHRMILSSCSSYFEEILQGITPYQHPVLFMRDIPFWLLKSICDYMYAGEVHICQNKLGDLLALAETLKIKGLAGKLSTSDEEEQNSSPREENKVEKKAEKRASESKQDVLSKPSSSSRSSSKFSSKHEDKYKKAQSDKFNKVDVDKYNKNQNDQYNKNQEEEVDPLDLLEPLYEEVEQNKTVVPPPLKVKEIRSMPPKKSVPKKMKKRKYSDHEPSPPPMFHFRKGTRSRPNVKIPKYYHSDYANKDSAISLDEEPQPSTSTAMFIDPLFDVGQIKTEPLDIDDISDEESMMTPVLQEGEIMDSFDVDVVEHSLSQQTGIEMSIVDTSCTDLDETNPLDESNPLDQTNAVDERNLVNSQVLEQSNPLDILNTVEGTTEDLVKDLSGNDKLNETASEEFHQFKKISLTTHPIITEVRSLIDETSNEDTGYNVSDSALHNKNLTDRTDKMEVDTIENVDNEDANDPLNITTAPIPDSANADNSQGSTAANSDKIVEYAQHLEATDDSSQASQEPMGHIESFGTVLSPEFNNSGDDTQQFAEALKIRDPPDNLNSAVCDENISESIDSTLTSIKIQNVQSLSGEMMPPDQLMAPADVSSSKDSHANEFLSDMPVLEPMVLEQNPTNHDISLEAPNITNSENAATDVNADETSLSKNVVPEIQPDVVPSTAVTNALMNSPQATCVKDTNFSSCSTDGNGGSGIIDANVSPTIANTDNTVFTTATTCVKDTNFSSCSTDGNGGSGIIDANVSPTIANTDNTVFTTATTCVKDTNFSSCSTDGNGGSGIIDANVSPTIPNTDNTVFTTATTNNFVNTTVAREPEDENLDVISEIERTIELLGGRSKTENTNIEEVNSMDCYSNQEFDDVPMADVTSDSEFLNESVSDITDSATFSMDTCVIPNSDQCNADFLADT